MGVSTLGNFEVSDVNVNREWVAGFVGCKKSTLNSDKNPV